MRRQKKPPASARIPELAGFPRLSPALIRTHDPGRVANAMGKSTELEFALELASLEVAAMEKKGGDAALEAVSRIGSSLSALHGTERRKIGLAAGTLSRVAREAMEEIGLTAAALLVSDFENRAMREWDEGANEIGDELVLLAIGNVANEKIAADVVRGLHGILANMVKREVENASEKSWREVEREDPNYGKYVSRVFGSVALHSVVGMFGTIASSFIEKPSRVAAEMLSLEIEESIKRTGGLHILDARHNANMRLQEMLRDALENAAIKGNCPNTADFASEMAGVYFGARIRKRGGFFFH